MEEQNTVVETTKSVDPFTNKEVKSQRVVRGNTVDEQEFTLAKVNQVIWYLTHLVGLALLIRIVFMMFGANANGVVDLIYRITNIFVAPFRGVFASPVYGESFFDSAAILAVFFYYILALIVTSFIRLFSQRNVEPV